MTTKILRRTRKPSGGSIGKFRKRRRYEVGSNYVPTTVSNTKIRKKRTKGGGEKIAMLSSNVANVIYNGKAQKTKILSVKENKADPHFVRRNILTKGAVIETELGKALVTSRPGQTGVINAKLIEAKEKK